MANINSITSNSYSSTSSLYGNRNVLTGLASGMDTEAMIQNSVSGYQTRITELEQSVTKLEWKQDAYRALTDQMYNINQKYMSYTSKTNLSSNAFFNNAITTTTQGTNAAAISATGSAKSDIQINAVKQLATAARYSVSASDLSIAAASSPTGEKIDWSLREPVGQIQGTMTLKYGSQNIEIKFTEKDTLDFAETDTNEQKAEKLKKMIEEKLDDLTLTTKKGTVKAGNLFNVSVEGNKFTFEVNHANANDDGSSVYINSVSGNVAALLGASKPASTENADKFANTSFTVGNFDNLVKTPNMAEYLSGKTVDVTLDGVTKQVKIGELTEPDLTSYDDTIATKKAAMDAAEGTEGWYDARTAYLAAEQAKTDAYNDSLNGQLQTSLQSSIDKQFGKGLVTVNIKNGALDFSVAAGSGSTLKVASEAGEKLGLGTSGVSNYFNTSKTLQNLLGSTWLHDNARVAAAEGGISSKVVDGETRYYDSDGNRVAHTYDDPDGKYYRVNDDGDFIYSLNINGTRVGEFTEDSTLESVLNTINSNADAGVKVSYSNLTSQFVFTARETGTGGKISFDNALAQKLFQSDSSNAPASLTAKDLLGDAIEWDGFGDALLEVGTVAGYTQIGWINKDDSVESLMQKLAAAGDGRFKDFFSYDEGSGTYQLHDLLGNTMSEATAKGLSINAANNRDSQIDFAAIAERANTPKGYTAGTNAVIDATVNGMQLTLERASNVVEMDGLSVTLKEEFSAYGTDGKLVKADAVTFKTSSNADDIVETVKAFVDDVNKLMKDVHDAFATQPAEKSTTKHTRYEPLTEEDKKDMSETAIANYEEKAKQGLLFGDSDLSGLYGKLRDAIQSFGSDRVDMESIGLTTTYSDGVTTISFNENKMRAALESNPDKVRTVFTKTKEGGAATNGLMATLKSTMNAYASTSIGSPGILVRKAGTKLSSLSLLNNNIQKQIDNVNKQIENWQSKLSSKIDYYTKQFTALEKLMSTMNNQSSMLSDLMGY